MENEQDMSNTNPNSATFAWTLAQATTPTAGAAPAASTPVVPAGMPGQTGDAGTALVPSTAAPGAAGNTPAGAAPGGTWGLLLPMVLVLGLMIVMSVFTGRKDKKKRQELMSSLKRGDTVQLSGGMIGTVIEIRDDDVLVKFDEGKIRFVKAAVQTILREGRSASGSIEVKDASKSTASV